MVASADERSAPIKMLVTVKKRGVVFKKLLFFFHVVKEIFFTRRFR